MPDIRENSDGSYYVNQLIDQSDPIGKKNSFLKKADFFGIRNFASKTNTKLFVQ